MKKLSATIIITVISIICLLSLSSCGGIKAPIDVWLDYESYTYTVENIENNIPSLLGSLIVTVERVNNKDISAGDFTVNGFTGSKMTYSLNLLPIDGVVDAQSINAISYATNKQIPVLSEKKYNLIDNTSEIFTKYTKDICYYTIDGVNKDISIRKMTVIDNEALYTAIRTYDITNAKFTASFNVVLPMQDARQSISVSLAGKADVTVPFKNQAIECVALAISLNTKLSGQPFAAYYATTPITVTPTDNDAAKSVSNVLVRFTEGNIDYKLTDISLVRD